MPKTEKDFQPGDECFYFDDDMVLRCRVIETNHKDPWLRFKLKILEVISPHSTVQDPEIGEVFDATKDTSFATSLHWTLREFDPILN